MSLINHTNKECGSCGAEYSLSYDDEQFGISAEEPAHCPFCGEQLSDYYLEENFEELDFEDE